MAGVYIQQWDVEKFMNSRDEWNELLLRSTSDKLFMSWEWQSCWWKIFSENNMQLRLYAATSKDERLIGIAPLYCTTVKTRDAIPVKRVQFIGNCWRGKVTMLTELIDFIVDKSMTHRVVLALCDHISENKDWDEFVIPFLDVQSETYKIITSENPFSGCYLRHAESHRSYYLNTDGEFEDYAKSLGRNTRKKLLNRRKIFEELGETSFVRMCSGNIAEKFALLNTLHGQRWNRPVFKGLRLKFNVAVAELMASRDCLNFSVLSVNGEPVSIQYNYVVDKHNYNIQAGFNESFHKKVSLGYLHFGYEIEASYNEKYLVYDFLAGGGKNTQYKERLTDTCLKMVDLQIVRNPLLKLLYRAFDLLGKLKSKVVG